MMKEFYINRVVIHSPLREEKELVEVHYTETVYKTDPLASGRAPRKRDKAHVVVIPGQVLRQLQSHKPEFRS